jgi:cytochrome P450
MSQRLNLFAPEVRQDPYPYYARMRRESPVCQVDPNGMWAITRYEDVVAAFKNPQVFSSAGLRMATEPPWLKRHNPVSDSLVLMDPPKHGRLRALVTRAFTTSLLNRVESYARDVCERLAIQMLQRGDAVQDFVSEFSLGVPANLSAMLIGFDPALQHHFKRWVDDVNGATGVAPDDLVRQAEVRNSLDEMERYCRELIDARRSKLQDDLVSDLIQVRVDGEALTDEELLGFISLLLVAGIETTMFLLTHCALFLTQYPEQMERLRNQPSVIPTFIEEVLRCEPPLHAIIRLTTTDTEVAGVRLPAHSPVLLMMASALRDESQFKDPDRFDPERGALANLAFGQGVHFCLGAPLARMEARVALDTLVSMVDRFELRTDRIKWNQSLSVRSPVSLPVVVRPL